jgi:hypothetical protein
VKTLKKLKTFFTAKTVGADKDRLVATRAGAAWVYADTPETFLRGTAAHAKRIAEILAPQPICQFGYLATLCRRDPELGGYEREYVGYLANVACAYGWVHKLVCQAEDGTLYVSYLEASQALRTAERLDDLLMRLRREGQLRFKGAAAELFGGVKASYYWAKSLLEHLVHLRLATHVDQWSVSS